MLPLLVSNPNIAIQRSFQRRGGITLAETWWEKENAHYPKSLLDKSTEKMEEVVKNDDIPSLRGWFLKEKRDSFKKKPILGNTSNRRWFTIERVPTSSGAGDGGGPTEELALCYYKRSSPDSSQEPRCGWIFLNDVLSLGQDIPDRWIIIEHPTRIMRLQSPTPAQHRVWFSTLSKCCANARKEAASPTAAANDDGERRPSLPYFSEDSIRKAKRNSLKDVEDPIPSTPKDELHFLREITGGKGKDSKEVSKNLFPAENTEEFAKQEGKVDVEHSIGEEKENLPLLKDAEETSIGGYRKRRGSSRKENVALANPLTSPSDLGSRLGSAITSNTLPPESEEKTEIEPLPYEGPGFEETSESNYGRDSSFRESTGTSGPGRADDQFDMNQFRMALSRNSSSCKSIPASHSFSSNATLHRSSSYQLHFGNEDDDDIVADEDFLVDDWDDEDVVD